MKLRNFFTKGIGQYVVRIQRHDPVRANPVQAGIPLRGMVVERAPSKNDVRKTARDAFCRVGAEAVENDDVKVLLDLESKMAQAWVQRDTQTLEQILADDYTLAGAGDALIGKDQYVAGLDNPEFRTTSAIVADLRIRVYGDAAVVTGRATYRGWSKKRGRYVRRFRFTDTFVRRESSWKCVATHASGLAPE